MKKGDNIVIPKGTPITYFSGSVLDKNPFHTGPIEYNCIGKVIDINSKMIAIEPWHHNSAGGFILNVPKRHGKKLKPTDAILGYDYRRGVKTLFHRDNMPEEGSREYDVEVSHEQGNSSETVSWTIWALSRKEALKFAEKYALETWGHKGLDKRASLHWRGQEPFRRADHE